MISKHNILAVFAYLLAALFLCYEMCLQAATAVMTKELMQAFSINAKSIGWMHSAYFIAYTGMQIPAGILFDKISTRFLLSLAIIACSIGAFLFAISSSFYLALFGRFLEGLGSAFAFVGTLFVASKWFEKKWFAILVGIAQAIAAIGAMSAGAPLALAIKHLGWRLVIKYIALFGFCLVPFVWCILKHNKHTAKSVASTKYIWDTLKDICNNRLMLYIALYAFCSWGPITIFAELWGESFLAKKFAVSMTYAGGMVAMIWVGLTLGSPVIAWFSEAFHSRKALAMWLAILGFIVTSYLIYFPISEWLSWLYLFLFGVAASGQILTFAMINDFQASANIGTSIGFINMSLVAGGAILGPLVGNLMHNNWQGLMVDGAPDYQLINYQESLIIIAICYLIAAIVAKYKLVETIK